MPTHIVMECWYGPPHPEGRSHTLGSGAHALLVPPTELSPEMEAVLGAENRQQPLSVAEQQRKLLEKPNLDGLSNWTPQNATVVRDLVLAFDDVFVLDGNELGCTGMVEHEI